MAKQVTGGFRARLDAAIAQLRRTPGIDVTTRELGKPIKPDALARLETKLGRALPTALRAAYLEVDGFVVRWKGEHAGELGIVSAKALIANGDPDAFEDQLWNQSFEGSSATRAKLERYRMLWSTGIGDGRFVALDLANKGALLYGETNELAPLDLDIGAYLDALLACGGLRFQPCFAGKPGARKDHRIELRSDLESALPGWPIPTWLGSATTSKPRPVAAKARKLPSVETRPENGDATRRLGRHYKSAAFCPDQVMYSPDGRTLALVGNDKLQVIDVASGGLAWELVDVIRACAFSPDGATLTTLESLTRAGAPKLRLERDVHDGAKTGGKRALPALYSRRCVYARDGRLFVPGDGVVFVLEGESRSSYANDRVGELAVSPDGSVYAIAGDNLDVYDGKTGKRIVHLAGTFAGVAIAPDATCVVVANAKVGWQRVDVAKVAAPKPIAKFTVKNPNEPYSAAFAPNGKLVAVGEGNEYGSPGLIRLFDTATWKQVAVLDVGTSELDGTSYGAYALAFAPDGKTLCAACHSGCGLVFAMPSLAHA